MEHPRVSRDLLWYSFDKNTKMTRFMDRNDSLVVSLTLSMGDRH